MNKYQGKVRRRRQNLLIVEGKHEKNKLFWLIFKCFPEMAIDIDDVWIYGTNIYLLYDDIVKEYGEHWVEENDDIDLPFVISKKQFPDRLRYKEDFTNIILVFDYERHDLNFSEKKIMEMQSSFIDSTDMGKLYINYPMIESYQHLCKLPDYDYENRKIPVSMQPGKVYKTLVESESIIGTGVDFPHRVDDLLEYHFGVSGENERQECCEKILNISSECEVDVAVQNALQGIVDEQNLQTAKYQLINWVKKQGYIFSNQTYWAFMRDILKQIVRHNICKANKIQYDQYQIEDALYKENFQRLDLIEILNEQNRISKDEQQGFIWVLNTCVFYIADYNFGLVG